MKQSSSARDSSLNVLARNEHGAPSTASPAISNGRLFLRTDTHLIAIGS